MKTKITVICENSVYMTSALIGEHGLSFLIENEDATLFDTGQGLGLMNNLKVLGKDSSIIKRVVLSHGHYDHTGGLLDFLKTHEGNIPVYLHPDAFNSRYSQTTDEGITTEKAIGIRHERIEYEKEGANFHFINGYIPITGSISALCEVSRDFNWKSQDARLKQKVNDKIIDDPFMDDLSLLITTDSGPVVLLGCAHAGIVEILNDISKRSGYREFHAVIGGTHLANAAEEYVKEAIAALKKYNVKKIGLSHCTGFKIACRFASEFQDKFFNASVGAVIEF